MNKCAVWAIAQASEFTLVEKIEKVTINNKRRYSVRSFFPTAFFAVKESSEIKKFVVKIQESDKYINKSFL